VSNNNNPFGFLPIGRDGGGPWSVSEYAKASAHTQAMFRGDIVFKAAISVPSPFAGAPVPGCTSLQNGTPGTTLWLGASINYGGPALATLQYVADDERTIFIGQGDDNTSLTVAATAGKNTNFITGTGNATTKQSNMSFDASAWATTAGLDIQAVRMFNRSDNAEGAYAIFEVLIKKHFKAQGALGI